MKIARVKIKDVVQCCAGCDTEMTLGDEVVYLSDSWYCSSECAVEGSGGSNCKCTGNCQIRY